MNGDNILLTQEVVHSFFATFWSLGNVLSE